MLADTEFTQKSGAFGTPMFSRPGKFTSFQYLCFNATEKPTTVNNDEIVMKEIREMNKEMVKQESELRSMLESAAMSRGDDPINRYKKLGVAGRKRKKNQDYSSSFKAVGRDKVASIFESTQASTDDTVMLKYNPKYEIVDKKIKYGLKFDYGVKGYPLIPPTNTDLHLCSRLDKLNQSIQLNNGEKQAYKAQSLPQSPKSNLVDNLHFYNLRDHDVPNPLQVQKDPHNLNQDLFRLSQYIYSTKKSEAPKEQKCLVNLKRAQDRQLYYEKIKGAHEKRFEQIKMPLVITQNKHITSLNIQKCSKRQPFIQDPKLLTKSHLYNPGNPQYEGNFETLKVSLGRGIPSWAKMGDRYLTHQQPKPFIIPDYYDSDSVIMAKDKFSRSTSQTVEFDKQQGRDNKMFFINEGMNLENKEISILEKLSQLDIKPRFIGKQIHNRTIELGDSISMKSSVYAQSQQSRGSRKLSLEEKILSGFYKPRINHNSSTNDNNYNIELQI